MKLGFGLSIEQMQKLVMTPELIQAIKILQFNTQELNEFITDQLLTNPVIETSPSQDSDEKSMEHKDEINEVASKEETIPEIDWKEYFKDYDDISYKQYDGKGGKEEFSYEQIVTSCITLTEHLLFQLQFAFKNDDSKKIGRYIIESLDGNGYLRINLSEIANYFDVTEAVVEDVLMVLQTFDPLGVCARNLSECLLIQVKQNGIDDEATEQIIMNYLDDVASNRLNTIAKNLNLSTIKVQEITDFIRTLEPKPGRRFSAEDETKYITPDVTVEKIDGKYIVQVNDSTAPRLNINAYYRKMLMNEDKDSNAAKFLNNKLNSAVWLLKSIDQRKNTIYNVVVAILNQQMDFFEQGKRHLKTLTLKQIADEVGIHESTVSRAVNGKYMQSPRGVFELKYFFTSGVADGSGSGGIASGSVKSIIEELVNMENTKKPLSDQCIAEKLAGKGIRISRRTVAKYRDEMKIPSSSKRKRF